AHDWLCGYRGGEAVLERTAALCTQTGRVDRLYTMFDDRRPLSPTVDAIPHTVSPLNRLPAGARRWLLPLYPGAVASLSRAPARRQRVSPADLLSSPSSAAIQGMRAPAGVPHPCYCHAPARDVSSIRDQYSAGAGIKT